MDQIQKMTKCLGHPPTDLYGDTAVKAAYSSNKNHGSHYRTSVTDLWDQFGFLSTQGLTLLTKLLEYDPKERWRATQALGSAYFTEEPLPATKMPRFLSSK